MGTKLSGAGFAVKAISNGREEDVGNFLQPE